MNIIELAKQSGWDDGADHINIEAFAHLVAAAARADEREECAKVCETLLGPTAKGFYGNRYAKAIRARGTT